MLQVQVYAQDISSTMREGIGYVVLDLRSAQSTQVPNSFLNQAKEIKLI